MSPRTSSRSHPIVALLTDFGTTDHYVASMKGIIAVHDPRIRTIDISHDIEPGRVRSGAYALWAVREQLPQGTVVIAVIDPGVGTERDVLLAIVDGRTYVAPDNGLLDMLLATSDSANMYRLSMKKSRPFLPKMISSTFHGRDIFAPIGARIAAGKHPETFGVKKAFKRPPEWRVLSPGSAVPPAILSVDRFGNVVTNIVPPQTGELQKYVRAVSVGKVMISVVARTFSDAPENAPCLIVGSSGMLEIVVRNGSAARMLRLNDRSAIRTVWYGGGGEE